MTLPPCRWTSPTTPRALLDRHVEPLPDEHAADCPGCEPCTADHCVACGVVHSTAANPRVCPACIADTRDDLDRIADAWADLPAAAMHGPAATAELPGGDATVMLGPGSLGEAANAERADWDRLSHVADESPADPLPPLLVLATWEDDWRGQRELPPGGLANLDDALGFLADNLGWAAQDHPAYDEFARDIAQLRGRLEAVTGRGSSDAHDETTCVRCGAGLRRRAKDRPSCPRGHAQPVAGCCTGGLVDDWECPRCHRRYTQPQHALARLAHWRRQATVLPAREIQLLLGVSGSTLRSWARRGYIGRRRLVGGRIGYVVADVQARLDTPEEPAS